MGNITRVSVIVDPIGGPEVLSAALEADAAAVWVGAEDDNELDELRRELEYRHE